MVLGRVLGAHGIRGELRIQILGDSPEHLLEAERLVLSREEDRGGNQHSFLVESVGNARPGEVKLCLGGLSDRDEAEAFRGSYVLADSQTLHRLGPDEFYWYQVVGCRVETKDGRIVGTVRELWETGSQDLLVVERKDGKDLLIPAVRKLVPHIDPVEKCILVDDLPGLLEPPS